MPAWSHLLTDTVTYSAPGGVSGFGDLTYGGNLTTKARVEPYTKIVSVAGGEQRMTTHKITSEAAIPIDARVWIPGDTVSAATARRALTVAAASLPGSPDTIYETLV